MTVNDRLKELREMTGALEKLIGKLETLHELTGGLLGEASTLMADVSNFTRWAAEDISNKQE